MMIHDIYGVKVYENPVLPVFKDVETVVNKTLFERWIEPFTSYKNSVEMPFSPWVKTKIMVTRERFVFQTVQGIITHPANIVWMKSELMKKREKYV